MGGKALNNYGVETERKDTKDFLRICSEVEPIVNSFGIGTHAVKCYHEKETHGDLDLLLKIDHEVHNSGINIRTIIEKEFKPKAIHNNGGVYSFDYDNFQIDFIPCKEKNWETSKAFFDYDPTGNLMGKTAHKFGLKYGFDGLKLPFRNFNGKLSQDIDISRDIPKIFQFLGYDIDKFQKGFDNIIEIFDWTISSKYFDSYGFQFENLNSIDKKRNRKRSTYNEFLEYIEGNNTKYKFKRKEDYIEDINTYFPEANLVPKLKELERKDKENSMMAEKFNGRLIMDICELSGKPLGDAIRTFKEFIGGGDEWRKYCLKETSNQILTDFLLFIDD
jgi:hypothetical protein